MLSKKSVCFPKNPSHSDIVGFSRIACELGPLQTIKMLNDSYCAFDRLAEKHSVYKVETIG